MSDDRTFVIVGAGQAGRWLALTLRADGYAGRIVWFGDEPHRPYDRPPLSKAALKGDVGIDQLALIGAEAFEALQVDFRPGQRVQAIDRVAREVLTHGGERVRYDALFLANGGRARTLPGLPPHPRVLTLRTHEDARTIRQRIDEARHVLVIGGGWIGLEVAASARSLGREVTVLEAAPRLCLRTVPPCVSEHLRALHEAHRVALRLDSAVEAVDASDRGVTVVLASGERIAGDCLIVGIGLAANDELAQAAGLATANGVLTDASGRTDDPAVYAVGDVANALRADGRRLRIESWENAQRQAVAAAKAALGIEHDPEAEGPPWFWSDQYDHNLQLLGLPDERHRVIERVVPAKNQRLFFFCDGARIAAVAAVNAGREVKIVRKWMLQNRFPSLDVLADAGVDLNKLTLNAAPLEPSPPGADLGNAPIGDWTAVGTRDQVEADSPLAATVDGTAIGIYDVDGELHAVEDICPHAMANLTQGFTDGCEVECPLHNAVFDVTTGKHLRGEPCRDIRTFPVRIVDARIEVRVKAA